MLGLAIVFMVIIVAGDGTMRQLVFSGLISNTGLGSVTSLQWLLVHAVLAGITGMLFLIAGILLVRWDATAVRIRPFRAALQLTVINLLAFYFNQFAMMTSALLALTLLLALLRYRQRFLSAPHLGQGPTSRIRHRARSFAPSRSSAGQGSDRGPAKLGASGS